MDEATKVIDVSIGKNITMLEFNSTILNLNFFKIEYIWFNPFYQQ